MKRRLMLGGLVTLGMGAGLIVACSDDAKVNPAPTNDAGSTADATTDGGAGDGGAGDGGMGDAGREASAGEYTVAISAGGLTACALSNKGRVSCWGDNEEGEFLIAPVPGLMCEGTVDCEPRLPTVLSLPYPVVDLLVGHLSTCAIFTDNGMKKIGCWGDNAYSQLTSAAGDASVSTSVVFVATPSPPKKLGAGNGFKLVQLEDGTIWGWGDNSSGRFGGSVEGEIPIPESVFPPSNDGGAIDAGTIIDFGASAANTFVVTEQGLWGTGNNDLGAMMVSPAQYPNVFAFTKLEIPDSSAAVASLHKGCARAYGQCYVDANGKAWCWGDNDALQVGNAEAGADTILSPAAVDLPGGRRVANLSVGRRFACAALDDGTVYCWGSNNQGGCGQANIGDFVAPAMVQGLTHVSSVSVGHWNFSCALTSEHKVYCWGDGTYGALGLPSDGGVFASPTPLEVPIVW